MYLSSAGGDGGQTQANLTNLTEEDELTRVVDPTPKLASSIPHKSRNHLMNIADHVNNEPQIAASQDDNLTDFGTVMVDDTFEYDDMFCMIPSYVVSETTSLTYLDDVDAQTRKQPEPNLGGYLSIDEVDEGEEAFGFHSS
jgi:hypothetical protein